MNKQLKELLDTLHAEAPATRRSTIKQIAKEQREQYLPELKDILLNDEEASVRGSAAKAISKLLCIYPDQKPKAPKELIQALDDPSLSVQTAAVAALGRIQDNAALGPLQQKATSDNLQMQATVINTLGKILHPSSIPAMYHVYLQGEEHPAYVTARKALLKYGFSEGELEEFHPIDEESARQGLAALIGSPDERSTRQAIRALLQLNGITQLLGVLHATDSFNERLFRHFLDDFREEADANERMGIARDFLRGQPSDTLWKILTKLVEQWPDEPERDIAVEYIKQHIHTWDKYLCSAYTNLDIDWYNSFQKIEEAPYRSWLKLLQLHAMGPSIAHWDIFCHTSLLQTLNELIIHDQGLQLEQTHWQTLLQASQTGSLTEVQFRCSADNDHIARWNALAECEAQEGMVSVTFVLCRTRQLGTLDDNPHVKALRFVRCPRFSATTMTALSQGAGSKHLTSLDFEGQQLAEKTLKTLAKSDLPSQLKALSLESCALTPTCCSSLFPHAEHSRIQSLSITNDMSFNDESLHIIAQWPGLSHIRHLDVNKTNVTLQGLTALSHSAYNTQLTTVRVHSMYFLEEERKEIQQLEGFANTTILFEVD